MPESHGEPESQGRDRVRRFGMRRRRRGAEDAPGEAQELDEPQDGIDGFAEVDGPQGAGAQAAEKGAQHTPSPAVLVSEMLRALSEDMSTLEERLSRLEEVLSPRGP